MAEWREALTALSAQLQRPMSLPETERIEAVVKDHLRAVFRNAVSGDDARFLAQWQRDLGFLLKQTVNYAPDHAEAWQLLGSCQERNPKWRRDAAESFQMALSIDPNHTDALISLGDLYKLEGLITRAQTCYEDALKIAPENQQAKSRLQAIKKR